MNVIPMFPLGRPLLPTELLPLYLFEERYLRLFEDITIGDARFGVVLIERGIESRDDNATFLVGCTAHLLGSTRNDDGSVSVLTAGTERFRIVEWLDPNPYPRALVDWLPEDPVSESSALALADAVERLPQLLALQSELHIEMRTVMPDFADDPVLATYQLAESIGLQAIDAQRVLEAETADMRVTIVSELLEETIELTRLQLGVR